MYPFYASEVDRLYDNTYICSACMNVMHTVGPAESPALEYDARVTSIGI